MVVGGIEMSNHLDNLTLHTIMAERILTYTLIILYRKNVIIL